MLQSNTKRWNDLGFEHVGRVVKCDKDVPCFYDEEDDACLVDAYVCTNSDFERT